MPCVGRYAEAWQYASFWCMGAILLGVDNSGAGPNAYLIDTTVDFINAGARPGVGQVLTNLTTGLFGYVTAVDHTKLTAGTLAFTNGQSYRFVSIDASARARIEHALNQTATEIHAALGAAGACSCTFSSWGAAFLGQVNIVLARLFWDCPCAPALTSDERRIYSDMVANRLKSIMTGEYDVCEGETGSGYPSIGVAQQAWTEFQASRIIVDRISKGIP